jgi:membrane protein
MAAIYLYINIISTIQTSLFARFSRFYGSLAFIPLLLFLVFGIWTIILFANSLVWAICNWTEADKKIWNWTKTENNL